MIPTIDLKDIGTTPVVADAMASHGCCLLANAFAPHVPARLIDHARETLVLPENALLPHRRTHAIGGYVPPGMEYVNGGAPTCRAYDLVAIDHGPTAFPPGQFAFEAVMRTEYLRTRAIASLCLRAMDASWGTSLEMDAHKGPHLLRALSYDDAAEDGTRFPEHRDFGLVSLFIAESAPGLECRIGDAWVPVSIPPGAMFLIAGTSLRLYHKHARPLLHRVIGTNPRVSAVLFLEAHADVVLPNGELAATRFARRLHGALRVPS